MISNSALFNLSLSELVNVITKLNNKKDSLEVQIQQEKTQLRQKLNSLDEENDDDDDAVERVLQTLLKQEQYIDRLDEELILVDEELKQCRGLIEQELQDE